MELIGFYYVDNKKKELYLGKKKGFLYVADSSDVKKTNIYDWFMTRAAAMEYCEEKFEKFEKFIEEEDSNTLVEEDDKSK